MLDEYNPVDFQKKHAHFLATSGADTTENGPFRQYIALIGIHFNIRKNSPIMRLLV